MSERAPHRPGLSHTELPTPDIEATREFYEDTLGFELVVDTTGHIEPEGTLRHLFFRCGDEQLIAFMEARGIEGLSTPGDVAQAAGVPDPMLHLSFKADSLDDLEARRDELNATGVKTSPVVDFGWCKSFYFKDPHGLMLEYNCLTEPLPEDGEVRSFELEMSRGELENFMGLS